MKQKLFFFFIGASYSLLSVFAFNAKAQEGNIWAFGMNAGVDFNTDPPTAIKTSINTNEGSASICDTSGNLLFYTDGTTAWDRNHILMSNGANLPGVGSNITSSTTQGALIVPMPGDVHKYYIFSLGNRESSFYVGRLYYSIVDMTLNNGWGAVVSKGNLLDSLLTEHLMGVSGTDCNIWLLVLSRADLTFKAYDITTSGISPNAVVSPRIPGGGAYGGIIGSIDISPDRNKVAVAQGNLVVYDFDVNSGKITHPLILDPDFSDYYYGVCFSPGTTKLYASTDGPFRQFDLSLADTTAIIASKTLLTRLLSPAIKRGPDGKVYCGSGGRSLNVINRPELAGTACQLVYNGFPLLSGTQSQLGLPNSVTIVTRRKIYRSITDHVFCRNDLLLTATDSTGINYLWDDNSTGPSRPVDRSGTYWVRYEVNSACILDEHADTFTVVFDNSRREIVTLTEHEGLCTLDTVLLEAGNLWGDGYAWNDNGTGMQRRVSRPGTYWVSYTVDSLCEDHRDSFKVTYPEKGYKVSFAADSIVCVDAPLQFNNTSDPHFKQFSWTFGDQTSSSVKSPEHVYTQPGTYPVMLAARINERCQDTAWQMIIVDALIKASFDKDKDSICVGQSILYRQQMNPGTMEELHWQMGDGRSFTAFDEQVQHAYDRSGIMKVVLNTKFRACPASSFADTVFVVDLPAIDLGSDAGLCWNSGPVIIKNRQQLPGVNLDYLWSTGATTESIAITHPGIYTLTLSRKSLGCSATESIEIKKDCYLDIANAFTPDGDGRNDYFFPRQSLSGNITRFRMQILSRWGQAVFETHNIDGRGWDGQFNGAEQPQGVYIYWIEAEFDGKTVERYQGNVTLIR